MDLAEALEFSQYASRLRAAQPHLFAAVTASLGLPFLVSEDASAALRQAPDPAALALLLRKLRQRVFLGTLLRDLTGRADLLEVCAAMTRLADVAIAMTVLKHHQWLAEAHGNPIGGDSGTGQKLIVVGMGKLGGGELNVSSDIDLVFVYPEAGTTDGAKALANQEFFERLGRRVIAALDEPTEDGFVFRVDMRLRPYGDAGPLCSSFVALETYLIAQGRTWERYAWLKARPLTGEQGAALERLIEPFVFRKYLDYDAYGGLRDVHRQIRGQGRRKDYASNIKLGPGGIREIEFIVQALQLVRGGREPALRPRGTRPALAALAARGLLPSAAVAELGDAYVFLRNVEHRLQYRGDSQTHELPADAEALLALACSCGFADENTFANALGRHRDAVDRHFDALFGDADDVEEDPFAALYRDPVDNALNRALLEDAGFSDPPTLLAQLARVRNGSRYLQLPPASRQRFDALMPQLLRVAAQCGQAQEVFIRLLALLETISGRSAYLALLVEHPPVLPRLAHLLSASAWAAEYLTRHPILLDELLDSGALLTEPDWQEWRDELSAQLAAHGGDPERQVDALRHFQQAQTFRLLAQDLDGRLSIERLADHLSALADIVLDATLKLCWRQLQGSDAPPPKFAIIGYGKLGGKELGYASDLDLVFLYEDHDEGASQRYARLAQRLNAAVTSMTGAGRLYDTDLRLRPDGASGLLVSSVSAFRNYQRTQAWTWEHQALTRARFVAGDASVGAAFEFERETILRLPRDMAELRADVMTMRQRMYAAHPNRTMLFDLKHDRGGMVDIEFAVQFLVLAHAHAERELTRNVGNIALLGMCAQVGLVPADLALAAAAAYREYRRLQHQVRLQGAHEARVEADAQAPRREAVAQLWDAVFGGAWIEGPDKIG
jgi:[glutamine synthetase] adenylyltransferase / [glutamine synthetase]-adenylyl-L-tyrosine phosphorylase